MTYLKTAPNNTHRTLKVLSEGGLGLHNTIVQQGEDVAKMSREEKETDGDIDLKTRDMTMDRHLI